MLLVGIGVRLCLCRQNLLKFVEHVGHKQWKQQNKKYVVYDRKALLYNYVVAFKFTAFVVFFYAHVGERNESEIELKTPLNYRFDLLLLLLL